MVVPPREPWAVPGAAPDGVKRAVAGFRRAVASDGRVIAAFIGGSFAEGTWDEHSDLDLYLIADDAAYDQVFAGRRSFVEAMGPVVLAEDFDGFGFDMVVFMLADGVEGELGLAPASAYAHIHGGDYRVLHDPGNVLEGAEFPRQHPTAAQRKRSLHRTVAWFWRQLSLFATATARGRVWSAHGYLDAARREALDLVWWIDLPHSWPGGYEKLETHAGVERAVPIAATCVGLTPDDQVKAADRLADFVALHGRSALAASGYDYPVSLETTVRGKLDSLRP